MLSAMPDGTLITDKIKNGFSDIGYEIMDDPRQTSFDLTEYGVPQNRTRIIILGVRKSEFDIQHEEILHNFYFNIMPKLRSPKKTVDQVIGDMPALPPLAVDEIIAGKKYSHRLTSNTAATGRKQCPQILCPPQRRAEQHYSGSSL
jgi:DNA (cytosine-5)-methyltransferase 1